jgi:hypothetical protein
MVPVFGTTQVLDHARPLVGPVMRAVDPHAVHALLEETVDERVVVGGFARHGDRDGNAAGRWATEHRLSVCVE